MSNKIYIKNARIVNEGKIFQGAILIEDEKISNVFPKDETPENINPKQTTIIDAKGKYLLPGIIDTHVHFRDPGLTHKADIFTESKAAIAGGVTSFMDMPNTIPNVLTQTILENKFKLAAEKSLANFSFYMGASNNNLQEVLKTNPENVCGVKVFLGSSTGNMLVDNLEVLNEIFSKSKMLIVAHCEDETIIKNNIKIFKEKFGEDVPIEKHALIHSEEACFKSSNFIIKIAKKHNSRLHVLHLSTAKETDLFNNEIQLKDKKITSEVCVHHLWFNEKDYQKKGVLVKWNPSIKTENDQKALFEALMNDKIDIITTDHAPHKIEEKLNTYFKSASGGPFIQHSLPAMLEFFHNKKISLEKIAEKMCHNPAVCFNIKNRGFIRKGYYADLTLVDTNSPWEVNKSNILYKCGWSPLEGQKFNSKITHTFVNGNLVFENGKLNETVKGKRLLFNA